MTTWLIVSFVIVGLIMATWLGSKIAKIFKGKDGEWSTNEFLQMVGAGSLLGLTIYMVVKEANRSEEWQLFGPMYILLVIGGFLTAVHLDRVLETVVNLFKRNNKDEKH